MNQVQVRCPSCSKLYAIDSMHIDAIRQKKAAPCIQCIQCPVVFSFEIPRTQDFKGILDSKLWTPESEFEDERNRVLDDMVPLVLRNQWLGVVEQFPEKIVHLQFLGDCKLAGQLDFALRRYKKLDQVLGNDPLCKEMIETIHQMMKPVVVLQVSLLEKVQKQLAPIKAYIPFVLGGTMIFGGLFNSAHRNMVGLGIVICIIGYLFTRRQSSS